jgi:hypothetical protein|tara:strand:+ start:2222 stop:2380 length:159 start_codon:yes stop_codon:yes gene_type:complete
MDLEIVKRNSELLVSMTKKYNDMLEKKTPISKKRKMESYIESLLKNIEKNLR